MIAYGKAEPKHVAIEAPIMRFGAGSGVSGRTAYDRCVRAYGVRLVWEKDVMEEYSQQSWEIEYISEDILNEAGLCGEKLSIGQLRLELHELEPEVTALSGKVEGLRKKYKDLKSSVRFSLIITAICFTLYLFVKAWYREILRLMITGPSIDSWDLKMDPWSLMLKSLEPFMNIFYYGASVYAVRAVYKLYGLFCAWDGELSRQWCAYIKKPNLSDEIFKSELALSRQRERLNRLKQVRTIYRERMQENWKDVPERIVMERGLQWEQEQDKNEKCIYDVSRM